MVDAAPNTGNGTGTAVAPGEVELETARGPHPHLTLSEHRPGKFHCVTEHVKAAHIHSARIGGEQKRFSRWKPGSVVTYTVINASFPSPRWARFAQRALAEAADAWNAKDVGIRFRQVDHGDGDGNGAVFALKYFRAPTKFLADAFAPDSKNRTLYVFDMPLRRENRQHLPNLFRHELGHVLGLRHDDAATKEPEVPSVELTPANTMSIMNLFTDFDHLARLSIQESDVAAVRRLCSLDQDTFEGFDLVTVDPDTLDQANFDDSDRLSSSIDSEPVSICDSDCASDDGLPDDDAEEPPATELEGTVQANPDEPALADSAGTIRALSDDAASVNAKEVSGPIASPTETVDGSSGKIDNVTSYTRRRAPVIELDTLADESAQVSEEATTVVLNESAESSPEEKRSPIPSEPSDVKWKTDTKDRDEVDAYRLDVDLEDALTPDRGRENMFLVQDNPFAFSPGQLSKLFNPKSHGAFYALGGLGGLEKGLRTDRKAGLSLDEAQLEGAVSFEDAATYGTSQYGELDDKEAELHRNRTPAEPVSTAMGDESFADRKRIFSDNRIPETMHKPILRLAWEVYCSKKSSIVLTLAAVVSFTLGMRRDLLASQVGDKPMQGWAEGAAILVCIAVSVVAGTANQWKTLRLLARLDSYENDRIVKVVRSGKTMEASVFDLLVGDVVCVSAGDIVPVDGILIEGHGLKCDESSCTGESDLLTKVSADQVYTILHDVSNGKKITARLVDRMDPFLISGAKVQEGSGTFLATAVGVNSTDGQIAMAMRRYPEGPAPQTQRIINLSSRASKLGIAMGLMLFVVCLIKFLSTLPQSPLTPEGKSQVFLALLLVSGAVVSLLFVSNIGSPLTAWTLTRMLRDNNLVRDRRAWEKVASVTTICTGKTSILTQNKMSVAAATFGRSMGFGNPRPSLDGANDGALDDGMADSVSEAHAVESLSDETKTILAQSAVVNATAFEGYFDGERAFVGCETEAVLMSFSRDHLAYFDNSSVSRHNVSIVRQVAFSAGTKLMSTTIRLPYGGFRVYVKGGAEIVLALCTRVLNDPASPSLSATGLTGDDSDLLQQRIASYGQRGLRPIALAYRDFSYLPGEDDPSAVLRNMTQLALFGIRDPIRPGITEAVRDCRRAGVAVRIVTGEHIETARWIARETGIWAPDSIALEGPVFRRMDPETQRHVAPRLAVLARASPGDKCVLVRILKEAGEVVAATGGNVDDPPALKIADVGFAKGISGTNAAKTAAPVVLMNDSFCSIVHCIRWGRTFGDAAGKFLQFKLTAATTAAVLTFVLAAASDVNDSIVLGVVQLLWVGMITDFAVLALATDTPTERIMDRKPDRRSSPVFPLRMAKMVLGQSLCHLAISLVLYFGWFGFAGGHRDVSDKTRRNTFVFNTFVWLQIFNKLNSRRLDNRFNVFEGIRNKFFVLVGVLIIGGQVLVMFVGGTAFKIVPLGARDWGVSIGIGALSLPCGALLRLVPDRCVQGPYESVRSLAERLRRAVERRVNYDSDLDVLPWEVRLDGTRERGE